MVAEAVTNAATSKTITTLATPAPGPAATLATTISTSNVNNDWKLPDGLELNQEYNLPDLGDNSPFSLPYWGPGFEVFFEINIISFPTDGLDFQKKRV